MTFTAISTARSNEPTVDRMMGGDPVRTTITIGQANGLPGDWLDFKEDLVTAGWQVLGSGDGLALYELSGSTGGAGGGVGGAYDVITTYNTGAGGFNFSAGGGTWWLMQTPSDADVTRYFVFALGDTGLGTFRWVTSRTAFSGGSALTRPSSANEAVLMGNPSTQAGRAAGPSGSDNKTHWVIGDKAEEYGFLFWTVRSGTTASDVHFVMGYDQVVDVWEGTNPPSTVDPDPHYMIACSTTSSGNSEAYFKTTGEVDGLFDPANNVTGRLEDFTTDRTAKICAELFIGESSPVVPTGHYSGVFMRPADVDNRYVNAGGGGFERAGGYNGYPYQISNTMLVANAKVDSEPCWIKGRPRGRLITMAQPSTDSPYVTKIGGRSMVAWGAVAVAWHDTLAWVR